MEKIKQENIQKVSGVREAEEGLIIRWCLERDVKEGMEASRYLEKVI